MANEFITLSNGNKLPTVGLGLSSFDSFLASDPKQLEVAISAALEAGYRHFDVAFIYRNENILGNVLRQWFTAGKIKREDVFITTKLPYHGNRPEHVEHFLKLSLKDLELDYVDLYLIHNPIGFIYKSDEEVIPKDSATGNVEIDPTTNLEELWKAMETQVQNRLAKSIGLSNYNISQVERIVKVAKILPVCNQVEMNLDFQQVKLRQVLAKHNIALVAYGPLGSPGRAGFFEAQGTKFQAPAILEDPFVLELANKYNKTPAQILIRFLIQLGVSPIPKSTHPLRVKQNFDVFNFNIDEDEMKKLISKDKDEAGRSFTMSAFKGVDKHPEFPFGK